MSMIPSAMESVPDYQPAPPDAQPQTLDSLLQQAAAMIAQDRIFSPQEQAAVTNFLAVLQQMAQQMGQQQGMGAPGANPVQQRMQQGGFAGQQERQTEPYGTPTRPNVSYGG